MELNLQRPLLFFDIESTGLDIPTESIIELCFVKVFPGNPDPKVKTWKIKPWDYENNKQRPVSPEASAINGITDDMLTGCPRFIDVAPEIVEWLRGSDLAGFNAAKFDLPLLVEEIERVKDCIKNPKALEADKQKAQEMLSAIEIDLHEPVMVDVQNIYHAMEPRNLKAAYRFYCRKELDNAHSAEADTLATYEVLKGQLDMYRELKNDISSMGAFAGKKYVDFSGRLIYDDSGLKDPSHILINFGKHKDKSAREVFEKEPSYFTWVENGSFPLDTKAQFARIRKELEAEKSGPASQEALNGLKEKWSGDTLF
ncbi:MAG: exonuclease domain-containing protein [Candidatus Cryptobacteroides sp.]|jgi:DNA polymerase-3 subunit epsilon|nr:3'-5' exonuclease [Rikenellaceae bacterium]